MLRSLSIPGVRRLTVLYALAELLEWFGGISLMLLVYGHTGSALGAGAMLVCKQIVPGLLTTSAGRLLDRFPSGRIIGVGFLIQASAIVAVGSLGYGPALYALAIGSGLGGTVARSSFRATIAKDLAGDERRLTTALIHATMGTLSLVGPTLAAGLATATSPQDVLLGAGLTGLALGAFTLLGPAPRLGASATAAATAKASARAAASASAKAAATATAVGSDVTEADTPRAAAAVGALDGDPGTAPETRLLLPAPVLLGLTAAIMTGFAMDEPSLLPYSEESLGAGAGGYGAILSCWGVGIIAGSVAFGRIMNRSMVLLAGVGTAIAAAGYLGLSVAPTITVACVIAVVGGFGNGFDWIAIVTAVQEATPDDRQGQAATRLEAIATVGPAFGYLLGGALADAVSPRITLFIPGVLALGLIAVGAAIVAARLRRLGPALTASSG